MVAILMVKTELAGALTLGEGQPRVETRELRQS